MHKNNINREVLEYDVIIVGGGPAGLSAACRLGQLAPELSVCLLEKAPRIGAHSLSGAVLEARALQELFPHWQAQTSDCFTPVAEEALHWFINQRKHIPVSQWLRPKTMCNQGNYLVSLSHLCRWLGEQAALLNIDIRPGWAATSIIFGHKNSVSGVVCGDIGVAEDGSHCENYQPGPEIHGKYTLFAEGCRGHLGKQLMEQYQLDQYCQTQHFSIGIKELWEIPKEKHQQGKVVHTGGWPLSEHNTGGHGFIYHMPKQQLAVGLVTDLSYSNPYLNPYAEFQRYKHHPYLEDLLKGGQRLGFGARALSKGGLQGQIDMVFPGGLIIGDDAGTLNAAKVKGIHTAMKSGMIAAEVVAKAIAKGRQQDKLAEYTQSYQASWAYQELYQQRNIAPALNKWGNFIGSIYAVVDLNLFSGRLPWTFSDPIPDYAQLEPAKTQREIHYQQPDGVLSFSQDDSIALANITYEHNQPNHLQLNYDDVPLHINFPEYAEPATRYCPTGVYSITEKDDGEKDFVMKPERCIHCKVCDIKDPSQNINWVTPEGGSDPDYMGM